MTEHRPTGKRERVDMKSGDRYIRRDEKGHFTSDQTNVGKSLAADRRQKAMHTAPKGQKDRGD